MQVSKMTGETVPNRASAIQVIARAGHILRALAEESRGLSLSDLAARVELPRSTVHRIITALESEGLVAAASPNGRYQLGPELFRLAAGAHSELGIDFRPVLRTLSAETNETVDLSVLIGDRVSFIDQVAAPQRLRAVSAIGASFPAHCTANGKALLACYSDAFLRRLLPAQLPAVTPNTITDREQLLEQIATIRSRGVAVDREEHTVGICAVGAALQDAHGPVAALSVPVPTQRFTGNEATLIEALLRAVGATGRQAA
jgi:DNA-binding IclR family transcriptional regulator